MSPLERFEGVSPQTPSHRERWEAAQQSAGAAAERAALVDQPWPTFSFMWWAALVWRAVWFVVKHAYVTVIWLVATVIGGSFGVFLAGLSLVGWFVCLVVKRQVSVRYLRFLSWGMYIAPVLGDGYRLWLRHRDRKALEFGNDLLRECQMVPWTDELVYNSRFDFELYTWFFDVPLAGATKDAVRDKIAAALPVIGAADFQLFQISNSAWEVEFYREVKKSALDEPRQITSPPTVDWDKVAVGAFYDEQGRTQYLSLSGTSGTLVGGVPGGGKTAFINEFLTPLLVDDRVRVTVCDGKGGADFDSVGPYVDLLWQDDEDFDGMIKLLEEKQQIMRERIKTNKQLTGDSNFWNTPITEERPVELIVLDECQQWLSRGGRTKDQKAKIDLVEGKVRDLIRRGRSAGVHVVLSTQRPSSDTINTGIRDLCGRRVAFRCTTRDQALMVLGETPEDAASPIDISAENIGAAVVGDEAGQMIQARAFYMPERAIEAYLAEHGTVKPNNRPGTGGDDDESPDGGPVPAE